MEFRLLGAFEVWDGEQPVEIAGVKRRALLALLALRANEVVRSELLIDELWGERPPRNAVSALHTHVSRLRKTLGADTIASREWGYVLRADASDIDLRRFEALVAEAEPLAAQQRAAKLAEALALWRGAPLADLVNEPALQHDIARLEELRLSTLERRIEADLEMGRTTEPVGELETLVAKQPLREHLRWLLILALYRAGRQAEALEVYRETRRVLTEELGLEPSLALKELEQAILRQDPSLEANATHPGAEPPAEEPDSKRRRIPPVALLALLAVGLAGTATAIALVRPEKGTSSGTATEAIFETLPTTVTDPATITHPATEGHQTAPATTDTTTTRPAHTTSGGATTSTKPTTTNRPTTTVPHKPPEKPSHVVPTQNPVAITDNFSDPALDSRIWTTWSAGSGSTYTQTNGQGVFSIVANPTFDPNINNVSTNIGTECEFPGNFDARIGFTLLQWPSANGVSISLNALQGGSYSTAELMQRFTAPWGDGYQAWPSGSITLLPDKYGTLRLTRSRGILHAYFSRGNKWIQSGEKPFRGEVRLDLNVGAFKKDWQQQNVSAAVDNFVVKTPKADCPAGSNP
jgi:DNA-binding SARP family transcriptional activator